MLFISFLNVAKFFIGGSNFNCLALGFRISAFQIPLRVAKNRHLHSCLKASDDHGNSHNVKNTLSPKLSTWAQLWEGFLSVARVLLFDFVRMRL